MILFLFLSCQQCTQKYSSCCYAWSRIRQLHNPLTRRKHQHYSLSLDGKKNKRRKIEMLKIEVVKRTLTMRCDRNCKRTRAALRTITARCILVKAAYRSNTGQVQPWWRDDQRWRINTLIKCIHSNEQTRTTGAWEINSTVSAERDTVTVTARFFWLSTRRRLRYLREGPRIGLLRFHILDIAQRSTEA